MGSWDQAIADKAEVVHLWSGSYSWDEVAVWTDGTQFYWAEDGGCSCNSFGDDLNGDDLKVLDSPDSAAFREAIARAGDVSPRDRVEFVADVRKAMAAGTA